MSFEITAALSSLKAAMDIVHGAIKARDDAKVQEALVDMARRYSDVVLAGAASAEKIAALTAELSDAKSKLRELQDRQEDRAKYLLRQIGPGALVYALELGPDSGGSVQYFCQVCFDRGQKSQLVISTNGTQYQCLADPKHSIKMQAPGFFSVPIRRG